MNLGWILGLVLAAFVSSVLTALVRRFALRRGMLDVPGPRSSHDRPTPRGGGLGFVLVFLGMLGALLWLYPADRNVWVALLGGGLLVSGVGWWDDRKSLSSWSRLGFYALATLWAVIWLGGMPRLSLGVHEVPLGISGGVLAWLGAFAFLNIYNFMDGIDGLAAGEGLTVSLAAGCMLALAGDWPLAIACWALAAGLSGFLPWNWHPAKIFMGDVGSNFLGFTFCILAIASENRGSLPALVWVLLLGVFVVDGGVTFLRRMWHRERLYVAHKSHAYQRAVQRGYSHGRVSSTVLGINAGLAILALVSWKTPVLLLPTLGGTVVLLLVPYLCFTRGETHDCTR